MAMLWKPAAVFAAMLCYTSLAHGFSYSKATLRPYPCKAVSQDRHSMLLRVSGSRGAVLQERNKCSSPGRFFMMAIADVSSAPITTSAAAANSAASVSSSAVVAVPAMPAGMSAAGAAGTAGAAESAVANTGTVAAGDIFSQVTTQIGYEK
jgi:hypothetical protein